MRIHSGWLLLLLWLMATLTSVAAQPPYQVYVPLITRPAQNPLLSGEATYYHEADGSGACLFDPVPGDRMVAAISYLNYGNADYCGAYVEVFGPQGSVVVRIVDMCPDNPGCGLNHLDLSPEAFDRIAPRNWGRVSITWRIISPPLHSPVQFHLKDGSNPWWLAFQVRNHRNPITRLEYLTPQGQWVQLSRATYNYFIRECRCADGESGPFTLRITDLYGNVLTETVQFRTLSPTGLSPGELVQGSGQFPYGP
ncbi:expansin EXLX1 family cellulose-binding protein [Chloroflexus sp.]|uniref:expansin EXLX1 family cellulose-binding protein n=1 Tax=Chloroflexus sp. TaxID=1904827 RepID=UPI0026114BA2|nr:expansin EXLX1 family cellulose-binding protein [uncultured Chloroflexus sp.]